MKRVAIIVVTYNRLALLQAEIDSLRAQTYTDHQIIVINNSSTDGTSEWLSGQTDIITVEQPNVGGAGGFERGIDEATRRGYEFCWIMDDDVECDPTALEELVKAYDKHSDSGFLCSRVVGTSGAAMNTPVLSSALQSNGYSDAFDLVGTEGLVRIERATFVSVLIPTKVVLEVGLPIGEFFIWGDDTEYTTRISQKHRCYMACRSEVVHKRAEQANSSFLTEKDPKRLQNYFYMIRNGYYIFAKYRGNWAVAKRYVADVAQLAVLAVKLDFTHVRILARAMWAGLTFRPVVKFSGR